MSSGELETRNPKLETARSVDARRDVLQQSGCSVWKNCRYRRSVLASCSSRTRASGICGSDLMEWYRIKKAPLVLGHEITGEVVEVGEGVERFKVGDRVFSTHHVPCGKCRYCLAGHQSVCDLLRTTHFEPGGFAEYIRVPKINVELGTLRIPDSMTFDEGSFIEPLGVRRAGAAVCQALTAGQTVLGDRQRNFRLAAYSACAAHRGAARIIATDISDYRSEGGGSIRRRMRPCTARRMCRRG